MKEKYLHVKDHPTATLTIEPTTVPADWKPGTPLKETSFRGRLKLHGVEKEIQGLFQTNKQNDVTAQFELKLSDYKIDIPSYLGVTIADLVKVKTEFKIKAE